MWIVEWEKLTMATVKMTEPVPTAMNDTSLMKSLISLVMGVGPESTPDVNDAIRPMTVLSPVFTTTPFAIPIIVYTCHQTVSQDDSIAIELSEQ